MIGKKRMLWIVCVIMSAVVSILGIMVYRQVIMHDSLKYDAIDELNQMMIESGYRDGTADSPGGSQPHGWKVMALTLQTLVNEGYSECNGRIMEFEESNWLTSTDGTDYVAIEMMNGDMMFFLLPIKNQENTQERLIEKADRLSKELGLVQTLNDRIIFAVISDKNDIYVDLLEYFFFGGRTSMIIDETTIVLTLEDILSRYR